MNPLPRLTLLACAALALTACGRTAPPQASDQPPVTVINGKVATWSGIGSIAVPDLLLVSAPVNADGTFTLTLPGEAALTGRTLTASEVMTNLDCTGSLSSSAPGTRGFLLAVLNAQDASGVRQVSAVEGTKTGALSRSVHVRAWLYTDGPTQLRGTVNCARMLNMPQLSNLPVDVAVNTQRGWNVLDLTLNLSATIFGQVSGSGGVANSAGGTAVTTWRTLAELQAQLGF
ncbi:hypothetical protein [Deinococcus sp. YIM 77859]|uniref:hypothetical protein n=1 Tax=Deinococcus sp. YIM 77859 TaxID=1540221 RepID=UPI000554A3A0|nr:hypothetical protein [Deinococcus sp. YIM 77859]